MYLYIYIDIGCVRALTVSPPPTLLSSLSLPPFPPPLLLSLSPSVPRMLSVPSLLTLSLHPFFSHSSSSLPHTFPPSPPPPPSPNSPSLRLTLALPPSHSLRVADGTCHKTGQIRGLASAGMCLQGESPAQRCLPPPSPQYLSLPFRTLPRAREGCASDLSCTRHL